MKKPSPRPRALPGKYIDMLRTGDHDYASDSQAVFACIVSMVNCGWSLESSWQLYNSAENGLRRRKPSKNSFGYFAREWDRAVKFVELNKVVRRKASIEEFLVRMEAAVFAHAPKFKGAAGSSDRAVLGALMRFAQLARSQVVGASVRQIAEVSQVSTRTVGSAQTEGTSLYRLTSDGTFLRLESEAIGQRAARDRLMVPSGIPVSDLEYGMTRSGQGLYAAVPDAFTWKGLGLGPAKTWSALHEIESTTVNDLQQLTGQHRTTVKRHLIKLERFNLVRPSGDGWVREPYDPARLQRLAIEEGIPQTRELRVEQHRLERLAFLEWNQQRDVAVATAKQSVDQWKRQALDRLSDERGPPSAGAP